MTPFDKTIFTKVINMKKNIIPILMFCIGFANIVKAEDTDLNAFDNIVYISSNSLRAGETCDLSICLKNTLPIRGFEFNLYMPEGISVVKNSKGRISLSLKEARLEEDDEHTISASEQDDGSILVLCGSEYPEYFTGNDGGVATLKISIPKDITSGEHSFILKNIKLAETDISKKHGPYEVEIILSVTTGISDIKTDMTTIYQYYNLAGQRVGKDSKGINVILQTNGKSKKILTK